MSNYSQGFKKALGIAPEVTFDTHVGATSWLAVKESVEIADNTALLETGHLTQVPYKKDIDLASGQKSWSAKFESAVPVKSLAFKELLKGLFGGIDTEGAGPYTHTYRLRNNPLTGGVSLTKFMGDGASMVKASGGRVRGLTLKGEANGFVTAAFDMMGATYLGAAQSGSPSLTLETPPWFKFSHVSATLDAAATEFGGFQIDIKPGLSADINTAFVLGSAVPARLDWGGLWDVSGSFTRRWLDDTPTTSLESQFLTLARARTVRTLVLTMDADTNKTLVITAEIVFDIPTRSGTGIVVETVPWKVVAKNTGGAALGPFVVVITDDEATPADAP